MVLRGDLDPAGLEVLDRVVGAAVAERQLEGLEADRAAEQLVAEADAEHRPRADELAERVDDVVERGRVAGAVGEEDRVGVAGERARPAWRCTGAARPSRRAATRLRTIEPLMPVSIAAIRGRRRRRAWSARAGVTSRARSRPVIGGSAAISSRASRSAIRSGKTPPRIAPASRMWRTSARVSTPVIAGTPQSPSQSSQPRSAPGASSVFVGRAHDRGARLDAVGLHRLGARTP